MPSTRKQKAKEKRSRQSDVMSDLENIDVMLGVYPGNQSDDEIGDENVDIDSRSNGPIQEKVQTCENFRALKNTENRNGNENLDDTNRRNNSKVTNHVTMKLGELKRDFNIQIMESTNSAIHETILPSLQARYQAKKQVWDKCGLKVY